MLVERLIAFSGNHLFLVSLFFSLLALLLWGVYSDLKGSLQSVTPEEAVRLMNHKRASLLDLRPRADFEDGHIIHAQHALVEDLSTRIKHIKPPEIETIILCCNNGSLSSQQLKPLAKQVGRRLCYLKGGIAQWRHSGLPLHKKR